MILRSGLGGARLSFYAVPLSHITFSAPGLYTSMLNKVHEGTEYAVSFDFSADQKQVLLTKLSPSTRASVSSALQRARPGVTVNFAVPVQVDLHCRLGKLERGTSEEFVPLVVEQIA
jgi:hypothetical protein